MSNPYRILYVPRCDASREAETKALAAIYGLAIRSYEQKKAANNPEGGQKGDEHGFVGNTSSKKVADDGEFVNTNLGVDNEQRGF